MSNALFPSLPGMSWPVLKQPEFNTIVARSVNLSELRGSFTSTPVYNITLRFDVLREGQIHSGGTTYDEYKQLLGFFLARQGKFDSWLFQDEYDSTATLQTFGTGNGSTTAFQLRRTLGAFSEATSNIATGPSIFKAGVLQSTGVTVSNTGLVTFSTAPLSGEALTWSGTYYYRCRFLDDTQDFEQFMRRLFGAREVKFVGSLGTKI